MVWEQHTWLMVWECRLEPVQESESASQGPSLETKTKLNSNQFVKYFMD